MEEALEVEMKDLKLSRFFNVLILGLAASLANFNFAWSLPADSDWGAIQLIIAACKTLT